ncbi:MAG: hypothetical protein JOZ18_07215 [Chloroflexi bacterium]|nr:hypothetical protein [Chloroflexota bacterium]
MQQVKGLVVHDRDTPPASRVADEPTPIATGTQMQRCYLLKRAGMYVLRHSTTVWVTSIQKIIVIKDTPSTFTLFFATIIV